ncbi:LacI family transcriptional regulator [Psychroflexus sp. CAK1W]|uniref:LacI family DNA-binding transcriptional regulator n=2 Tax=Psychroflexus curvus TaxID=2873595 RepID=UPI001CC98BE6|nr:LacI family DNA-binding transcriptional regulator [Psychroflexus curvus]MBZ9627273.1 LacI family transcriptional regulator [Psychroflexus curvus]
MIIKHTLFFMVTLKELAKQLNVSVSTVSKALHDAKDIGEDTKKRIKEAAELYNYRPNKTALALKVNKTNTIGVVVPDILNPFFAKVLHGIEEYATAKGYDTIICVSNEQLKKEAKSVELMLQGRVDGFIASLSTETLSKENFVHLDQISLNKKGLVLFDRTTSEIDCDKVVINDQKAIYDATRILISKKKTKIAFVSTIEDLPIGLLRKGGYQQALVDHGIEPDPNLVLDLTGSPQPHGLIKSFLSLHEFDAVISADNTSSLMFQSIVKSEKPELIKEIMLIGFSDEKNALLSYPRLNYIDQKAMKIGEKAAEMLISRLEAKDPDAKPKTFEMPFEIHIA